VKSEKTEHVKKSFQKLTLIYRDIFTCVIACYPGLVLGCRVRKYVILSFLEDIPISGETFSYRPRVRCTEKVKA
jgi:hypothetical protein